MRHTLDRRIAHHLLFIFILASGCAGSSVHVVKADLAPKPGTTLHVMPFVLKGTAQVAEDWRKTGETVVTPEGEKVDVGIYQYTLEGEDVANLRASILASVEKSKAFQGVVDTQANAIPGDGWVLELTLGKRGMGQTILSSTCFIEGHAVLKKQGQVLGEQPIAAAGSSMMTVSSAKNEAIEKFTRNVMRFLARF